MDTRYIVIKTHVDSRTLMYFAGTTFAGSAPRWSSDYKDAVQFPIPRRALDIVRAWGGTMREVDA